MLDQAPTTSVSGGSFRLQRSHGAARLGIAHSPRGSAIASLYQKDPCRFLFPDNDGDDLLHAVLLTTSGGLAGGDSLEVSIECAAHARALVAAQAAEKIYRALGPAAKNPARFDVQLTAASGAWLEFLPQETILFEGAGLRRRTRIDAATGGRVLAAELLALGRSARGEIFTHGYLHDAWQVRIDGKLVWEDALRLAEDVPARIGAAAGLGGMNAMASVLYVGDDADKLLEQARALADQPALRGAVTRIGNVLIARFLAGSGQALRAGVAHYWSGLRHGACGLPRRMPRLWHI